jgi:pyocin large subunit-like protein
MVGGADACVEQADCAATSATTNPTTVRRHLVQLRSDGAGIDGSSPRGSGLGDSDDTQLSVGLQ